MAELIPYKISKDTKSLAERTLFDTIKNDARMRDWVVFHSLHIEHHICQIEGEADFVILAPNLGCFVIEVKGGGISLDNKGVWTSTDRCNNTHKIHDPFIQASNAAHSIKNYINNIMPNCPSFAIGIAFPDVKFNHSDITFDKTLVFDNTYNWDFFTYIRKLSEYYQEKARKSHSNFKIPSSNEIYKIRRILRPEFEKIVPLSTEIDNDEREHIFLTEQQMDVLDKLQFANSAIIHGPAGTGKTLLAVEMAKRKASQTGTKVALITYTLYLTDFLKMQVKEYDNISVFSISDFFEKKCIEYNLVTDEILDKRLFYVQELPKLALKVLAIEPIEFDTIIVDEAQDFASPYLILTSLMLKGHIAKGNYFFFGDFLYQGIYDTSVYQQQFKFYIDAMDGKPADLELTTNVRNSYEVQQELDKLTNTSTYSIHSNSDADFQSDIYATYTDEADEIKQIEKTLNKLIHNEKISPSKITILSRKYLESSVATKISNFKIKQFDFNLDKDCISFSSIRKYKGLENDIILVIDNDSYDKGSYDLHFLYVALSRAKTKVIVFENEYAQLQREELLKQNS